MKTCKFIFVFSLCLAFVACSGNGNKNNADNLPADNLCDTAKVAFMVQRATPDSVARFICNTAIGLNKGVSLKSLQAAVLYAYEKYKDEDLQKFSEEFDFYAASLPLAQKMQVLSQAALADPDGLGYKMGLEYAFQIQSNKLSLKQIDAEIQALKNACGKDSITYLRVLNGLSIALSMPEYSSLPKEILDKYTCKIVIPHKGAVSTVQSNNSNENIVEETESEESQDSITNK